MILFLTNKVWPFIKQHWLAIVIALLMFAGGLGLSQAFVKPEIIEKTKIETVIKEVEVIKEVKVKVKDTSTDISKDVHREITTTKYPDGREVKVEVIDSDFNKKKIETQIVYKDRVVEKLVEVEKKVEVIKEVKMPGKDWRVGVDFGTNIPNFSLDKPFIGIGNESNFTVGVRADRRILGPVWLGAAGYLNGSVLIGVSAEF